MILEELTQKALQRMNGELEIADYSFALPYTYVVLKGKKGRAIGVAATLAEEIRAFDSGLFDVNVRSFLKGANSFNIIERTLALATVNAVSQYYLDLDVHTEEDALQVVEEDASIKKVAVVGSMFPIVEKLKDAKKEVYVFERNKILFDDDTLSDGLEYQLLPKMDAVLATGTVLLNGTVDLILDRALNSKVVALLGATAQALPEFFIGRHITHLGSTKIKKCGEALKNLKLGVFRGSGRYNRRYNLKI